MVLPPSSAPPAVSPSQPHPWRAEARAPPLVAPATLAVEQELRALAAQSPDPATPSSARRGRDTPRPHPRPRRRQAPPRLTCRGTRPRRRPRGRHGQPSTETPTTSALPVFTAPTPSRRNAELHVTSPATTTPERPDQDRVAPSSHRNRPPRRAPVHDLAEPPQAKPRRRPRHAATSVLPSMTSSPWSAPSPAIPDAPVCLCVEPRHQADRGSELAAVTNPTLSAMAMCPDDGHGPRCYARRRAEPAPRALPRAPSCSCARAARRAKLRPVLATVTRNPCRRATESQRRWRPHLDD
ncbi:vegetative cell wall protein gp1 [Sorghum bicolor]|uniref:vegetative cell wall protein gp1 n=1 Tax=Sorghum bicolor TaxID=4558 RepID=UPI000B426079|nr:vegetative cell wall protein gp1 [Sorghum bicolor]|eukprot:XP_021315157.1 vegetative cell wall protein gp1 [Sorghum bicolor]